MATSGRGAERGRDCDSAARIATPTLTGRTVSFITETVRHVIERLVVRALAAGPLPSHVAFIMDGNRRWSRHAGLQVREGHQMGFSALRRILELCMSLGQIRVVTVYAFAIDNFRRSRVEVDALMELARTRLLELLDQSDIVARHSIRIRVVGRRSLLPKDVQDVITRVENATRHHSGCAAANKCAAQHLHAVLCTG